MKAITLILLLLSTSIAIAEEEAPSEQAAGEVSPSGVSKIFAEEEELPMTTIIMPWRETAPKPIKEVPIQLVTEALVPIDPQVFQRQLQYYSAPLKYRAE